MTKSLLSMGKMTHAGDEGRIRNSSFQMGWGFSWSDWRGFVTTIYLQDARSR